jgi:hypothetical protein
MSPATVAKEFEKNALGHFTPSPQCRGGKVRRWNSRQRVLDCGGKRSATPLSHARKVFASSNALVRPKAPSPLPLCRRSPRRFDFLPNLFVWFVYFVVKTPSPQCRGGTAHPRNGFSPRRHTRRLDGFV